MLNFIQVVLNSGFSQIFRKEFNVDKKPLAILFAFALSSTASAGEFLSADEVKNLFTNKTFDIHVVTKDKDLQGYDSAEGEHIVYIPWKDKTKKRKWWMEDNKHCTSNPKRGDSCKLIKPAGDGVYHGITDGEHTHTLSNFREGNQL